MVTVNRAIQARKLFVVRTTDTEIVTAINSVARNRA
jgi:hypothetical protein